MIVVCTSRNCETLLRTILLELCFFSFLLPGPMLQYILIDDKFHLLINTRSCLPDGNWFPDCNSSF